jgi:hypothetical protein
MRIRVETKNHEILSIELSGEWRVEPVDLRCLVGPTVAHYFTPEGYYDHAEPRPYTSASPSAPKVSPGVSVGPAEGDSCVP